MAFFMALAAFYGVLQLAVLGWLARTVRLSTLLVLVPVGAYGCGAVVAVLQLAYTRGVAAVSGDSLTEVLDITSYTAGPVIEELVKVAPLLLVVGANIRSRLQWGLTDYVVAGAGLGAGFAVLEGMLRFGGAAERANAFAEGGWVIPTGLSPSYIPGPVQVFGSWLPAPVGTYDLLSFEPSLTNLHLVWTAMAGLGVGLLFRGRGLVRLAGVLPILFVIVDHAGVNYAITEPATSLEPVLNGLEAVRWAWPLVALVVAMVVDVRLLRRVKADHPDVLVAAERDGRPSLIALAGYGLVRIPFTTLIAARFAAMRRAACYAFARTPHARGPAEVGALVDAVRETRDQIDTTNHPSAWRGVRLADARTAVRGTDGHGNGDAEGRARRRWRLLMLVGLPCLFALPAVVYLVIGGFPTTAAIQEALTSPAGFAILAIALGLGVLWMGWRLLAAVRTARAAADQPYGEALAVTRLRVLLTTGGLVSSAAVLARVLTGPGPRDPLLSSSFLLDALEGALGGLALALMLIALLSAMGSGMGPALVLVGGGPLARAVAIPLASRAALAGMGALAGALLNVAHNNSPSGGSGGGGPGGGGNVPDIPQRPPAKAPRVGNGRLQNIIDELFRGSGRSDRIGDGSTMDAVRNELRTGRPTGNKWHTTKAVERINALQKWLRRNRDASEADQQVARSLLRELRDALRTPPGGS